MSASRRAVRREQRWQHWMERHGGQAAWMHRHPEWGHPDWSMWGGPPPPSYRAPRWAGLWLPVIISFIVQVPAAIALWHQRGLPFLATNDPWQFVIGVGIALVGPVALVFARRAPGPVVAIVAAAASADLFLSTANVTPPYISIAFAIVGAVIRGARVWAWISIAVAWVASISLGTVLGLDWPPGRVAFTTLGILIVFGLGESNRARRDRISEVRRRVAERKLTEVQAERVRIARELHDVLAHSLSQINVQAGVGLHLLDKQPQKAAEALASIKETSKSALDEVRSVLGVLRAEGGADPSAPLVPEPDLSRLAGLAASVNAQGLDVEVENALDGVPKATQLAIYRIVQESLTNVVRHAAATRVRVSLREVDAAYQVSIADNGTGSSTVPREGGRGLLGMRERAELLGGTLDAAPIGGGGFRVLASIPRATAASVGERQ